MMYAFVWTLPAQKLLLLVGLAWKYGDTLRPADFLACVPEIITAGLLTSGYRQWHHLRWRRMSFGLVATFIMCLSWIVIALWLATGTPVSYHFLLQFIREPALWYTSIASSHIGLSLVFTAVTLCVLWGGVVILQRRFTSTRLFPLWNTKGMQLTLLAFALLWQGSLVSIASPTFQLAFLAPLTRGSLVVILGDHGEIFPEERAGEVGRGQHVYEPSLHSPLLVFFPNRQGRNRDLMKEKCEMIYNPTVLASLPTLASAFQTAQPFKHIMIDGLFDADFLQQLANEFYPTNDPRWQRFENDNEGKLGVSNSEQNLPPLIRDFVRELNAEPFLKYVAALTGIEGLIPDPYLGGAGMHCIPRGGKLAIHANFNTHPLMKLDRRLNLLIYLNTDWQESYGGHLELWDRTMRQYGRRILPVFNRTVLFLTDDFSFHGHPEPLNCPPDRVRKSIAMYYYTNGRPESELQNSGSHGTLFQERPRDHRQPAAVARSTNPLRGQPAHTPQVTQQQQASVSLVALARRWLGWR